MTVTNLHSFIQENTCQCCIRSGRIILAFGNWHCGLAPAPARPIHFKNLSNEMKLNITFINTLRCMIPNRVLWLLLTYHCHVAWVTVRGWRPVSDRDTAGSSPRRDHEQRGRTSLPRAAPVRHDLTCWAVTRSPWLQEMIVL